MLDATLAIFRQTRAICDVTGVTSVVTAGIYAKTRRGYGRMKRRITRPTLLRIKATSQETVLTSMPTKLIFATTQRTFIATRKIFGAAVVTSTRTRTIFAWIAV